ncbi:MAG: hypothetical protein JKY34_07405 [Kordiimonadaceae bacterium]|nr:hypothetical protein [Kordiimonadaceae bacterium]
MTNAQGNTVTLPDGLNSHVKRLAQEYMASFNAGEDVPWPQGVCEVLLAEIKEAAKGGPANG